MTSRRNTFTLFISSVFLIIAGVLVLTNALEADNGTSRKYKRVYSDGLLEISPIPFNDSTFGSGMISTNTKLTVTSAVSAPQSVGVTHAYIPVSTQGSMCPLMRAQVIANTENDLYNRESDIFIFTGMYNNQVIRIGNLNPGTHYFYQTIVRGCDTTFVTYERDFTTLPYPGDDTAPVRITKNTYTTNKHVRYAPTTTNTPVVKPVEPIIKVAPNMPEPIAVTPETVQPVSEIPSQEFASVPANVTENGAYQPYLQNDDSQPVEPEAAQQYEDIVTEITPRKGVLPKSPREWIALALLILGTIGIVTSFIPRKHKETVA